MTLTNDQVASAALNVIDGYLDTSIDAETVTESVDTFFADGWAEDTTGEGDIEDVEVNPDAEDYTRISEEVGNILRHLRDQADSYYDR